MSNTLHLIIGLLVGYAMGLIVGINLVELAARRGTPR